MLTAIYHIMVNFVNKLLGTLGTNSLKKYDVLVEKVNQYEDEISQLSDQELKNKQNILKTN